MRERRRYFFILIIFLLFNINLLGNNLSFEKILESKPDSYVMDYAGVIGEKYKREINALIYYLNKKSSIEIAVVSIPELKYYSIEEAAVKLFEKWGIGKKGKDNGLLLIFSLNPKRVRIEVGYGLEEAIPDAEAGRILDKYTVPFFKKNEFGKGAYITVIALINRLNKYYNLKLNLNEANKYLTANSTGKRKSSLATIFLLILLFFIFMPRMGWFLWFFLTPFGVGGFGRGGYYSDDNDFFGGFGGGFGGFGGGMSGGGGASRGF